MKNANDHGSRILLAVRAAHRPRRTGHADRLGGHWRRRQGRLLPGKGVPPVGQVLRGVQGRRSRPQKGAARRLDGSPSSRTPRGPCASLRSDTTHSMKEGERHEPRKSSSTPTRRPSPSGWWSPTRRSTTPRRTAARSLACSALLWARRRTPFAARPSPSKPHRGTTIVGEMGTGKTFIGAAAAHMAGFQKILVLCPLPPGAQVEAGGGADGAPRPRRHRRVHHRPGEAALPPSAPCLTCPASRQAALCSR